MTRSIWWTTSVIALLWAGTAHAHTRSIDQDDTEAARLDEVVVTAERRTSNLQTIAVAATVLSGEDVQNKGVASLDQLVRHASTA